MTEGLSAFLAGDPYGLNAQEKEELLYRELVALTEHHRANCAEYQKILEALGFPRTLSDSAEQNPVYPPSISSVADLPFLPVRIFKEYQLSSVPQENIQRIVTSSGTSGQQKSRIVLDAQTAKDQRRVLSRILSSYIGDERLPLLIIDASKTTHDRAAINARRAGIVGFSVYGKSITYALDDDMNLDVDAVRNFAESYKDRPCLLFGYTYMIWKYFSLALAQQGLSVDFGPQARLFHVGGWKKLAEMAVDDEAFRKALAESCGLRFVHNYYGMAEQLGSVFVECEHHHMHASVFSDVIVRNPSDLSLLPLGQNGLLETISVIPRSYPGHILLTEDEGVLLGVDDCPCGRKGKYFKVLGRMQGAEIRGCSDTYADGQ